MPIYEYRCTSCGFQKEYLQKVSDPALTECPECGAATFAKMVTAAGFQLKGTGWYVTDFKHGSKPPARSDAKRGDASSETKPSTTEAAKSGADTGTSTPATASDTPPASS